MIKYANFPSYYDRNKVKKCVYIQNNYSKTSILTRKINYFKEVCDEILNIHGCAHGNTTGKKLILHRKKKSLTHAFLGFIYLFLKNKLQKVTT